MAQTTALDAAIRGLAAAVERAKAEVGASVGEREGETASQREWMARALAAEARVAELEAHVADAEARVAELEDELALVTSRVEAFEYGVRVALLNAFKLVRDVSERVGSLLGRGPLGELPRLLSGPGGEVGEDAGGGAGTVDRPAASASLEAERLDAALERLRASTAPLDEE